jgi:regulator of protease activity HflC (stomatin/prohibitin superfamily)
VPDRGQLTFPFSHLICRSFNPLYAVRQNAQSSMRAAIGHLELDDILHTRETINNKVARDLQEAGGNWGMTIKRYEITEITPDRHISGEPRCAPASAQTQASYSRFGCESRESSPASERGQAESRVESRE